MRINRCVMIFCCVGSFVLFGLRLSGCNFWKSDWARQVEFDYSGEFSPSNLLGLWTLLPSVPPEETFQPKAILLKNDIFDPFLNKLLFLREGSESGFVEVVNEENDLILCSRYPSSIFDFALDDYYSWREAEVTIPGCSEMTSTNAGSSSLERWQRAKAIWRLEKVGSGSIFPGHYRVVLNYVFDRNKECDYFTVGGKVCSNAFIWRFKRDHEPTGWSNWKIPDDVNIWQKSGVSTENGMHRFSPDNAFLGVREAPAELDLPHASSRNGKAGHAVDSTTR